MDLRPGSWTATPSGGRGLRRDEADAPGGRDVAAKWGEIIAYADRRGRPRPVNDAWIAACCLTYELPHATLNVGHFDDLAEYEGLELLTP